MRIIQVQEMKFALDGCVLTLEELDRSKLNVQIGFKFKPVKNDNLFTVTAMVNYKSPINNQETTLVSLEVANIFEIKNITEHIEFMDMKFNDKSNVVPTMVNVAVGTIRGILAAKVAGTILAKFPLPLMNVKNLIEPSK